MELLGNTDIEKFLWYNTLDGAKKIYGDNIPQEVTERIHMEMGVITANKFTDYILIIWDIHDFCRTPTRVFAFCATVGIEPPPDGIIPIGPGRGSVGGSMVCYCIGIHECDPILFGLYFERFLNPERIAYPDIDFDISQRYRHIVLAYISWKYGYDRVAQIITFGTLSAKSVTEEVLKAGNVSQFMITTVKSTIPDDPEITIDDMVENKKFIDAMKAIVFPDSMIAITPQNIGKLASISNISPDDLNGIEQVRMGIIPMYNVGVKSSWNYKKAIDMMLRLEGLNKHESTHAAGVVIAPVELQTNVPLLQKDGDGVLACQYDMRSLEDLGYLKMDALGLRTVDVNHDAEQLIRKWYDPSFSIRSVRYDDENAIKLIRAGDTIGIFQIESSGFTQMMMDIDIGGQETPRQKKFIYEIEKMRGLEIQDFMWISAGIALYRPGPLDAVIEGKTMVQHLIDRKKGTEPVIYLFPEEESYLSETYGVMVYQEQVMMRVRQMTGCTLGRADILRKAMGKKDPVLMKEQMDWFVEASMNHNFSIGIDNAMVQGLSSGVDCTRKMQIVNRAKEEIDKFARYGFNKAHTVEYGHICYRNAFIKANYPVAFYTTLLNSYVDDPKRQAVIIRDMIKHGIQLLPPLINESQAHFTMTDINTIRFGLAAIKGIGEKGLKLVMEERRIRGDFKSAEDFRIRIPATFINVVGMTALAQCGAFDKLLDKGLISMPNRATLVASMKNMCDIIGKAKQKKGKNKSTPTIAEVLSKFNNGVLQYEIIQAEEDLIEYATWEKSTLNYFISAHPIDAYTDEIERWTAIQDTELEDLPQEFYIAGFIGGCHETIIKKEGRNKGKAMGFVTVETAHRAYEATLFPGIYESCLPYMKAGNPVVLKGKRGNYKGIVSIEGLYIRNMTNSGIRDCPECHIRLQNINPLELMELRQMFNEHPGITQVFIHVMSGYHDLTLKCTDTIGLNDRIIEYCKRINAMLAYKPI